MTANAGLHVIVTDPAYTSRWGAEHWLGPLREHHPKATGHHAAALVTGRRGLGHRARRRATGNHTAPAEAARPAQARPRTTPAARPAPRKPATPRGPRQPPGTKTRRPHRITAGNQAAQDRPGSPAGQDYVLLAQQERLWVLCLAIQQIGRGSGWRCPAAGSGRSSPCRALGASPSCWRIAAWLTRLRPACRCGRPRLGSGRTCGSAECVAGLRVHEIGT